MQSVPITANVVNSNPAHGEVYSIQHYVIKFVSDLRRLVVFLGYSNKTDGHDITELLLKVVLSTISLPLTFITLDGHDIDIIFRGGSMISS